MQPGFKAVAYGFLGKIVAILVIMGKLLCFGCVAKVAGG